MNTPPSFNAGRANHHIPFIFFFFLFFFSFTSFAQTQIDCADGPVNDTYCYGDNDTTEIGFQSSTGFPMRLTFNSGLVEANLDELVVLDSDGVTNLNTDNPYGNNGDLSGLTFISSGDTISFIITSDGSISCQGTGLEIIDYTVECLDCQFPSATFEPLSDCTLSTDFTVDVDVTDLAGASSLTISDDQGSPAQTVTQTGIVNFGPYLNGQTVLFTVVNDDNTTCAISSEAITAFCPGGCTLLNAGEDIVLDCNEPCATLSAEIIAVPQVTTSSYRIQGPLCDIPPVTGGTPTNLEIDDEWTGVIDLEFTFNYFETDYTQIVVGANGQISFNTSLAGGQNFWSMDPDDQIPSNDESFPFNTIYGAFHDMNPAINSDPERVNYFVTGDAPYRIFVLNFNDVPHFGTQCDGTFFTTQQILLYESLNVIDVNIIDKPSCPDWNDGLAVIGLQGNNITEFSVPPTRNTSVWEATNENWRFVPDGEVVGTNSFEWQDETGAVIGTDPILEVCPSEDTTYTAVLILENPDGTTEVLTDDVFVDFNVSYSIEVGEDQIFCDQSSASITVEVTGINPNDATYLWSTGETTQSIDVDTSDNYTVEVTFNDCTLTDSVNVILEESPSFELGPDINTCFEENDVLLDATPSNYSTTDVTFEWSRNSVVIAGETNPTLLVSEVGTYTVLVSSANCDNQDVITIAPTNDIAIELGEDFETCFDEEVTLNAAPSNYDPALGTYQWSLNGTVIDGETTPDLLITEAGTYSVLVTIGICSAEDTIIISPRDDLQINLGSDFRACPNDTATLTSETSETGVTYAWFLNGDPIADANESTLSITIPETIGSLNYTVEITAGDCSGTAEVSILPYAIGNCTVSEGLSPNGDGSNDCLDLEFLADRAGNFSLEVFNRYGMSMFSQNGYINTFCGISSEGNELPTGTYYYVIKFDTPDQEYGELKTGWVYINRAEN